MAASVEFVSSLNALVCFEDNHTLLSSLVFLLVLLEQHIVWQRTARHRTLGTHRMTLARQRASTLSTIGQCNTALFLNVHRTLGLRGLSLGLIFLLLFLRLLLILVSLTLLPFPVVLGSFDGAFLRALLAGHHVVTKICFVTKIVVVTSFRPVGCVACLLLLARFLLLRLQTAADVLRSGGLQHGSFAMLANHGLQQILLVWFTGGKRGSDLVIQLGQR